MRHHLAPILAVAAFAGAGPALAQDATAQTGLIPMSRAMEIAQGSVNGGVLEAELETENGVQVYEIEIVQEAEVFEISVNAETGEIVSKTEQRLESFVSGIFQDDELAAAQAARGTLQGVLADMEGTDGARIEELSLDEEDGRWLYEIEMEDGNGRREVLVDATTGEIVSDDD